MLKNKVLGLFVVSSILAAVAGCSGDDASSDASNTPAASGESKPGEETPAPGTMAASAPRRSRPGPMSATWKISARSS